MESALSAEVLVYSEYHDVPRYMTEGAAGFDIQAYIPGGTPLALGQRPQLISTGLYVKIPEGYELQIRSRSGNTLRGFVVSNSPGTIDSDYTGEIKILLHKVTTDSVLLRNGDRIAQAVLAPCVRASFTRVKTPDNLGKTERGDQGFGSTDPGEHPNS